MSLGHNQVLENNPFSKEKIETLLDESFLIFNRYSSLYSATKYSRKVDGHDDFKSLLKFMNLGLQKWDDNIENEINNMKRKQAEQRH